MRIRADKMMVPCMEIGIHHTKAVATKETSTGTGIEKATERRAIKAKANRKGKTVKRRNLGNVKLISLAMIIRVDTVKRATDASIDIAHR